MKFMKKHKKALGLFLALIVCLGMLPLIALAVPDKTTPLETGDIVPEVVMTDEGRTAEVTYTRPGAKTDLHVICLVDTSIDNPEAAGIMSGTVLPACDKLRSGSLSGTTASTITYQNTVQVLSAGSTADREQLIGGFSYGSGQSNETAALNKALEIINSTTQKTPVVFWVPAPAQRVDPSYELEQIKVKLAEVQAALRARGGALIVWQMGDKASNWITGDNTHTNYAPKEEFQVQVQDSLAKVVRDYTKDFSLTLDLGTEGLAQSITGVTVYDVRKDWDGDIERYPIQGAKTTLGEKSVTVNIPDLPDWMELEISLTVALNPDLKGQSFPEQDIVSAATTGGTHYTGIFDDTAQLPVFQNAKLERPKLEQKTATFTFKSGDGVTGSALTAMYYPGDYVSFPDISSWDAGNKTFSGWLTDTGAFYKPGEMIRMPECDMTLTAIWGEADIQLRLGDVTPPGEIGNRMYGGDTSNGKTAKEAWTDFLTELKWRCGAYQKVVDWDDDEPIYGTEFPDGVTPGFDMDESKMWTNLPPYILSSIVSVTVEDKPVTFASNSQLWDTGIVDGGITFDKDGDGEIEEGESGLPNAVYIGLDENNPVVAYITNRRNSDGKCETLASNIKESFDEWYDLEGEVYTFDLHIAGNGGVTAPECLSGLFSTGIDIVDWTDRNVMPWLMLEKVDLHLLDTSKTTDMSGMFYACPMLNDFTFGTSFKTSNVTDMSSMFYKCGTKWGPEWDDKWGGKWTDNWGPDSTLGWTLNLSSFDTSSVTNMRDMFKGCFPLSTTNIPAGTGLTGITFGAQFKTSKVTDMSGMFEDCGVLSELDVSGFDTSKVTDMSRMFSGCGHAYDWNYTTVYKGLTSLNLNNFDTSNVTDMNNMFSSCCALTSLDLSSFDTSQVTDMGSMFSYCTKLTEITFKTDSGAQNGGRAKNMKSMFSSCTNLTSLDLSNFTCTDTEDMSYMFSYCEKLASITFGSDLDTSKLKDTRRMFADCVSLTSIDFGPGLKTGSVENMYQMFYQCKKLESLDLTSFDTRNVRDMSGMFYWCAKLRTLNLGENFSGCSVENDRKMVINQWEQTFHGCDSMFERCYALTSLDLSHFLTDVDASVEKNSMRRMFYQCSSLETIDFGERFDTSRVADMSYMFEECEVLTNLNLTSAFDASATTSLWEGMYPYQHNGGMQNMFKGCKELTEIDLSSSFKEGGTPTKCNTMKEMFSGCSKLKRITFGEHFNTSNVINMSGMFEGCGVLSELDVSMFDTSKVEDMNDMFSECSSLTSLNLSNFVTTEVKSGPTNYGYYGGMAGMFYKCSGLTSLDVSRFDTKNVPSMSYMFAGCTGLTTLDVSSFDTSNVTGMSAMFAGCSGLTEINFGGNFYLCDGSVKSSSSGDYKSWGMFQGCSRLPNVNGLKLKERYNTLSMMTQMFADCTKLETVDLSAEQGKQVTFSKLATLGTGTTSNSGRSMFAGCTSLKTVDLSGWDVPKLSDISNLFNGCSALETANLGGWVAGNISNVSNMFYGCTGSDSLTIDISWTNMRGSQLLGNGLVPSGRTNAVTLEIGEYPGNSDNKTQKDYIIDAFKTWDTTAGGNKLTVTANGEVIYRNGAYASGIAPTSVDAGEIETQDTPDGDITNGDATGGDTTDTGTSSTDTSDMGDSDTPDSGVSDSSKGGLDTSDAGMGDSGMTDSGMNTSATSDPSTSASSVATSETPDFGLSTSDAIASEDNSTSTLVGTRDECNFADVMPKAIKVEPASLKLSADGASNVAKVHHAAVSFLSQQQKLMKLSAVNYNSLSAGSTSPATGSSGPISAETVMPEDNYELDLPTTAQATPVRSVVPYIVRVKYESAGASNTQGRSGVIRVEFPLPDGIEPQNSDDPSANIEVGAVRSLTGESYYEDGGDKIAVPFKLEKREGKWVLTGEVQGLFIGTYLDVTVKCKIANRVGDAQSQLTQWPTNNQDTKGSYWEWLGAAQAWFDGHTKTSRLRLWDFEENPTQPETPQKALVTYENQGDVPEGISPPSSVQLEKDQSVTLSNPANIPETHEFKGWKKADADGNPSGVVLTGYTITDDDVTNGVKFIGVWKLKDTGSITVKYQYANNGEDKVPPSLQGKTLSQTVKLGTSHQIMTPNDEIFGYEFAGWHTVTVGNVEKTNFPKTGSLNTADSSLGLNNGDTVVYTGAWKPLKGTIKFDPNYTGATDTATQQITLADPENLDRNTFIRTNYTFKGWSTTPGGEVEYLDGGNAARLVSALDEARKKGEKVILYAVWEPGPATYTTYTVEYYYDNKKGEPPAGGDTGGSEAIGSTPNISCPQETTVGGKNYKFDKIDAITLESGSNNVVKVYYVINVGIEADNITVTYDGKEHPLPQDKVTVAGAGDSPTIEIAYKDASGNSVDVPKNAGIYTAIIKVKDKDGNEVGTKEVTITINKAKLTATYKGETIKAGETPKSEVTVTGFVNGENAANAEGYMAPTVDTSGINTSAAGAHTLTPNGGAAKNYEFVYVPDTLTVTAAEGEQKPDPVTPPVDPPNPPADPDPVTPPVIPSVDPSVDPAVDPETDPTDTEKDTPTDSSTKPPVNPDAKPIPDSPYAYPTYRNEMPDPNDPNSPDIIVVIDVYEVPAVYVKTVDPEDQDNMVYIEDSSIPLAGATKTGSWALLNLILAILTVLASLILIILYLGKKRKDKKKEETANWNEGQQMVQPIGLQRSEEEEPEEEIKKKFWLRLLSVVVAIVSVVLFILTEDMRLPMVFVDNWTLWMVVVAVVQLVVCLLSKKRSKKLDDDGSSQKKSATAIGASY